MNRTGLALALDLRSRLRAALVAALLAILACAAFFVLRDGAAGVSGTSATGPKLPAGLQAAIDRTLSAQPQSSPGGVRLWWGKHGAVSFAARRADGERAVLQPLSLARSGSPAASFSPGGFVFGKTGTSESLGVGVGATYTATDDGFEQRFTLARRPGGSGGLVLSQALSGGLRAAAGSGGTVSFETRSGSPLLTYGGLRVTGAPPAACCPRSYWSPTAAAGFRSSWTTGMPATR